MQLTGMSFRGLGIPDLVLGLDSAIDMGREMSRFDSIEDRPGQHARPRPDIHHFSHFVLGGVSEGDTVRRRARLTLCSRSPF